MGTDMPVAFGKPINAGLHKFCMSCAKCAENCPTEVLSTEKEPYWEPAGDWSTPGVKTWYFDQIGCMTQIRSWPQCAMCQGSCPWGKKDNANIHEIVGAIAANTSIFNGFFTSMDNAFGYGLRTGDDIEKFWDLDLPEYGVKTTIGHPKSY